ncbi:MAG: MoaD/ThiS family protein [Thermoplasmatota archaeon]
MSRTKNLIHVKFFSSLREAVGIRKTDIEIEEGTRTSDLMDILADIYPSLEDYDKQVIIAVNKEVNRENVELKNGDDVALMPPVVGG